MLLDATPDSEPSIRVTARVRKTYQRCIDAVHDALGLGPAQRQRGFANGQRRDSRTKHRSGAISPTAFNELKNNFIIDPSEERENFSLAGKGYVQSWRPLKAFSLV